MPGVLIAHWELVLPEGCMGGSLPPCGIRLARDDLEACRFCSALRAELHELDVPALSTRATEAGVDYTKVGAACSCSAAKEALTELLVERASALDVQSLLAQRRAASSPTKWRKNRTFSL
eukprot:COSAG04_NODE_1451_length_6686_cov_13.172435_8_plen_120_part_00